MGMDTLLSVQYKLFYCGGVVKGVFNKPYLFVEFVIVIHKSNVTKKFNDFQIMVSNQ